MRHDDLMDHELDTLSESDFLAGWRRVVGEPPAALLEDRRAMIALLVDSVPVKEPPSLSCARGEPDARERG